MQMTMKDCSLYAIAIAMLLHGCSSSADVDEPQVPGKPSEVKKSVALGNISARLTRAINNQWTQGDSIGVVLFDVGTADISDGRTNYHYYTAESNTGNFTPISTDETAYYPSAGGNVDILAYYPFNPNCGDLMIPLSTVNQSNVPMIDFMVTDKLEDRNADNPSVALTFRHKMARVNLKLSKDSVNADLVQLNTAKITYMGGPMTAVWSMAKQDFASKGAPTDLPFPFDASKGTGTAIVIPSSPGDSLKFKIEVVAWGGFVNTYYAKIYGDVFEPGTNNNISIRINNDQVKIVDFKVTDWTVNQTITGNGEAAYE